VFPKRKIGGLRKTIIVTGTRIELFLLNWWQHPPVEQHRKPTCKSLLGKVTSNSTVKGIAESRITSLATPIGNGRDRLGRTPHNGDNPGADNRHHGIGSEFVHRGYRVRAGLVGRIERTMTDNDSCYQSKMFRAAYKRLDPQQVFTTLHSKDLALYRDSMARMGAVHSGLSQL
jgi:hypothetical protein